MIFFEDIEVGARESFGAYPVTREEVIQFATIYDPQPFHLDDAAAAKTHFGRLSASGWHTCGMVMRMIVDNMTAHSFASLGSPGIDELRWLRPVYPGDTLRCESEVLSKSPSRSRPEMGSVRNALRVVNQDDKLVMTYTSIALVRTRGS